MDIAAAHLIRSADDAFIQTQPLFTITSLFTWLPPAPVVIRIISTLMLCLICALAFEKSINITQNNPLGN